MSLPYFPIYPTDFEAKTSFLSLVEDGAYNRLLRLCWMTAGCSVPNDDQWIMRRMRVHEDEYEQVVKSILIDFFKVKKGRYFNPRLSEEFKIANAKHKARVLAGKRGAKAKQLKTKETKPSKASSNAKASLKQPELEPEPELEGIKEDTSVSSKPPPKKPPKTKRKTGLPENWRPNSLSQNLKDKLNLTQQEYNHEFSKFTDSAHQHGRTYVDWNAAWRTWLQSPYGTWGRRMAGGTASQQTQSSADDLADAFNDFGAGDLGNE